MSADEPFRPAPDKYDCVDERGHAIKETAMFDREGYERTVQTDMTRLFRPGPNAGACAPTDVVEE